MKLFSLAFWLLVTVSLAVAALEFHAVVGAVVILWIVWIFDCARRRTRLEWNSSSSR